MSATALVLLDKLIHGGVLTDADCVLVTVVTCPEYDVAFTESVVERAGLAAGAGLVREVCDHVWRKGGHSRLAKELLVVLSHSLCSVAAEEAGLSYNDRDLVRRAWAIRKNALALCENLRRSKLLQRAMSKGLRIAFCHVNQENGELSLDSWIEQG